MSVRPEADEPRFVDDGWLDHRLPDRLAITIGFLSVG